MRTIGQSIGTAADVGQEGKERSKRRVPEDGQAHGGLGPNGDSFDSQSRQARELTRLSALPLVSGLRPLIASAVVRLGTYAFDSK